MKSLTKREQEVVDLLLEGKTNREIAERLFLSFHTVKAVLEKIYDKVGIHNRVLLAIYFFKNDLKH